MGIRPRESPYSTRDNVSYPFPAVGCTLRVLWLAERRSSLRHVVKTVGIFLRVGLEWFRDRQSFGMVGVFLCMGVMFRAALFVIYVIVFVWQHKSRYVILC